MERVWAVVPINSISPVTLGKFPDFGSLVNVIVFNAFMLAGIICLVILVFGGFSVIMGAGSGDPKKMEQGKQAMTAAVAGLVIVILSVWIMQILGVITGKNLLSF